jgi:Gas vesicle protein
VTIERTPGGASLVDVLDRVLDKGIVIEAWMRLSFCGINLMEVEATRGCRFDQHLSDERACFVRPEFGIAAAFD